MTVITQTRRDLTLLQATDHEAYKAQLVAILGASRIMTNQAEYPEDYDNSLAEGDEGYVAAEWVEEYDTATLSRVGFDSRESVEARIQELDN
jgi:hypothetical protein